MQWLLLAGVCALIAVVLTHERRRRRHRWARLFPASSGLRAVGAVRAEPRPRIPSVDPVLAGSAWAAVLVLVLIPWPWAIPLAGAASVAAATVVRRLEPGAVRAQRRRLAADLPLVLDLLAAACASGAPPSRAMAAVADAVDGAWGDDLARVTARVELGASWSDAFSGSALTTLAPQMVQAWIDAEAWGAAPGAALAQAADAARQSRRRRGEAAARAVAVSVVGPLGVCFLPAFVLLGIVPAVLGALGPVLT